MTSELSDGRFQRQDSAFRRRIGDPGFPAEAGRYHLYVSLACPWAHRTMIVRELLGLQDAISLSAVDPIRDDRGWAFNAQFPDPLHGWDFLSTAYAQTDPDFDARVSVPVLWDTQTGTIVNNESAEIIVDLATQFGVDNELYPEALRTEIDAVNDRVYETLNNGVYRSGFSTSQEAYEEAVVPLFDTLDWLEERLADGRPWLMGDTLTLADIRLFTTGIRFDPVYHGHFKCNLRRWIDYPHLQRHLRQAYALPGIAETVDFDQIKRHYYVTHTSINPTGIVPLGPVLDL